MKRALLWVHFPEAKLPAAGFRCPVCGDETLLFEDAKRVEALAERLGLMGTQQVTTRKLLKTGNSLVVSIDPELARAVLKTTKPGTRVRVGRSGRRIVIERARAT